MINYDVNNCGAHKVLHQKCEPVRMCIFAIKEDVEIYMYSIHRLCTKASSYVLSL